MKAKLSLYIALVALALVALGAGAQHFPPAKEKTPTTSTASKWRAVKAGGHCTHFVHRSNFLQGSSS